MIDKKVEIEQLRFILNKAYNEGLHLTDGRMITMSQELDKKLTEYHTECYFSKKN